MRIIRMRSIICSQAGRKQIGSGPNHMDQSPERMSNAAKSYRLARNQRIHATGGVVFSVLRIHGYRTEKKE